MGKTFSESWHRVAPLHAHLRPQVRVRRQFFRGERWYLLHDPYNNQFFRLRPAAYAFVLRMGPKTSVGEAWELVLKERPEDAPGQQDVVGLLSQLYASNLLVADVPADTAALFQRYKKRIRREATAKILGAMFARFPLLDPDDFLEWVKPASDRIFSRVGFCVWLAVILWGITSLIGSTGELVAQSYRVLDPSNLPWLFLVTAILKAFHEFGHMALCKKFGGSVHRVGILLMIFTPMPYADTTSAWGFRDRWQRVIVGFGGMIAELFLAAIAAVVWSSSGPGLIKDLAFNAMLVGSVSTVLFNINPLLRFDGYFILSDLSGIPNLYQRSTKHLGYLFERYLFGLRKELSPANNRTESWALPTYGVAAGIYRFFLFGSILIFVWDRFLLLGLLMGLICLVAWILVPLGKLVNYLAGSPKLHLKRSRAVGVVVGCVALLLVFTRWIPFPQSVRADGIVQAEDSVLITAGTSGQILEFLSQPGSIVEEGQALLKLYDPELELSLVEIEAQLEEGRARERQALVQDPASRPVLSGYLDALKNRAEEMKQRKASLTVRAPGNGWWVAPEMEEAKGVWIPRGEFLGEIITNKDFEFIVRVPVNRMARIVGIVDGAGVVRLDGQPWTRLPVTSQVLVAASAESIQSSGQEPTETADEVPYFEFRGRLAKQEDAVLMHGLAGQIRFALPPQPLWQQGKRIWREFLERRSQT